jgi:formylglycine-generating enzyme required for sulfatase activity
VGHAKTIVTDFCMEVTEVTVAKYRAHATPEAFKRATAQHQRGLPAGSFAGNDACNANHADRDAHPINCVDRLQAADYCKALGRRLPSEWEWEWAARGRDEQRVHPWGQERPDCEYAIMSNKTGDGCGAARTAPVGSKPRGKSRDGVHDLAGNVAEWTSSTDGDVARVRGGSWKSAIPLAFQTRDRGGGQNPTRAHVEIGFRCVVDLAPAQAVPVVPGRVGR